jgi:hypothetical protein
MKPTTTNKFTSLQDVRRKLEELTKQFRQDEQLIDENVKQLARVAAAGFIAAGKELDFSDLSSVGGKKGKKTLNVNFPMVKVPNAQALQKNYSAAEKLSEQYKYLTNLENEVKLNFKGVKGSALDATLGSIRKLKLDVETQLRKLFNALNQVAEGHAPKEFKSFVLTLAEELQANKHIDCDGIRTMSYAALEDGELVFAGYIILSNAVNDEGKVAPSLYIVVKWVVGGDVSVFVEHDFLAPGLLEGGDVVESIHEAGKSVASQLSMEGFSAQIGNLPAELQLKLPKGGLNKDLFSVADHLQTVTAADDTLVFIFKPTNAEALKDMSLQLFQEVKSMLRVKRNAKVRMKIEGNKVLFTFQGLDHSGGIGPVDLDFLATKYGLDNNKIRKLVNVING